MESRGAAEEKIRRASENVATFWSLASLRLETKNLPGIQKRG
jgi:hypothetical protein